jgi:hypothetical protein
MKTTDGTGGLLRAVRIVGCSSRAQARDAGAVNAGSDLALLSSIATQVDELALRLTDLADRYGTTPDSAIAAELYAVERALNTAGRSLERATRLLADVQ